jgi:hypothetical protein
MFAYGPPDLDPTIRTYPDLDLISRVEFGSGGSGQRSAGRRRSAAGAELRGGELAGAGRSGAPVGHLGCGLVQKDERGTRKSLEHEGWRCCALAGLATARSGTARRRKSGPTADGRLGRAKGGKTYAKGAGGPGGAHRGPGSGEGAA